MREPITLTKYGEKLIEDDPKPDHSDADELGTILGIHELCRGFIEKNETSEYYSAIFCRRCYLRVIIPNDIRTYGELREYSAIRKNHLPLTMGISWRIAL